jgi:uncharacterized protein (TIGR02391 family)
MKIELEEELLNPRIVKHCMSLYVDGHYKHAALEAMIQVEKALKEKAGEGGDIKGYGVRLVTNLLGKGKGIKLRVPLGEDLQPQAKTLFEGAFAYYRNYAAHDGTKIDQRICLRTMVLASELLDLMDASSLSFADVGGIEGLVKAGSFKDKEALLSLLEFLDGRCLPGEDAHGFYEDLYERGFRDSQLDAVIELDLVHYRVEDYVPHPYELLHDHSYPDTLGWFELTDLGKRAVMEAHTADDECLGELD